MQHDPVALCKAPEELAASQGTGFTGEGLVREEKITASSWNASDPRLCPKAFNRAKRFLKLGRSANILPFHTPIKSSLNPKASQLLAPGVAVLFRLVFYIGSLGRRFKSLATY